MSNNFKLPVEPIRKLIRDIVFDIKSYYKNPRKIVYEYVNAGFGSNLDLEIILNKGKDFDKKFLKPYDIEAFWDDDTNTLEIFLNIDSKADTSFFYDLIGDLNDILFHELTHKKQYGRGDRIPNRRITKPEKYYTQDHELEAQIAGFKRKSKLSRVPLEMVMRDYFNKRREKYNLTDRIIDRIVNRLLNYGN